MPRENWTNRDLELEKAKKEALDKFSISEIIIEAIFDFLGISALTGYLKITYKKWWDHLIALIVAGSYLQALWWLAVFLIELAATKSFWQAIIPIIGEDGLKEFLKKIGKSWLIYLLIADLLYTIWVAVWKFLDKNAELKHDLYHLWVTFFDAPHRDEIFEINIGGKPEKPNG